VAVLADPGVPLPALSAVSSGREHVLGLTTDGQVLAWGSAVYGSLADDGALGNGSASNPYPRAVKGPGGVGFLTGIRAVAAGAYAGYALDTGGSIWAWEYHPMGGLGTGQTGATAYPTRVVKEDSTPLTGIVSLAAGPWHAGAIDTAGDLWVWGYNADGQLGDGTQITRGRAAKVAGLANLRSFAAGESSSIALTTDGAVWVWGANAHGQFGTGETVPSFVPVRGMGF